MYDFNVEMVRCTLVKGVRMIVAIRMLAKDVGLDAPELADLERDVREAGREVQRVEDLMKEDVNRPLISR